MKKDKRKTKLNFAQILLFLVAGSMNAIIDIGSLNIFLKIWPTTDERLLILFNTIAYILAIINSYFWNSKLAFRKYAQNDLREKVYFFLQAGISLILSNLTFLGALHFFAMFLIPLWVVQNAAKALAMAIPSAASFLFMKYFVFQKFKKIVS